MATQEEMNNFLKEIDDFFIYDKNTLLSNPEWGKFNFIDAEGAYNKCSDILSHFKTLPIDILPDGTLPPIGQKIAQLKNTLKNISEFNIAQQNPSGVRDQFANHLKTQADELYKLSYMHIPYLAYQRGDVERNIGIMISTVKKAEEETEKILNEIRTKHEDINSIVKSAREAAINAGVGHFTKDFSLESTYHIDNAKKWLISVCILSGVTLIFAIVFGYYAIAVDYKPERFAQMITSKIAIIVILLTAAIWCGKIYKSHMHLSFINKHRANALQTFLAFSQSTADEQTKNAVLLEAAHCIFSASTTGLVGAGDSSTEHVKFMEIFKSIKQ